MYAFDAEADSYLVADQNKHLYLVQADDPGLTRTHLVTVDKTRRNVELNYDNVVAQTISTDPEVFAATLDIGTAGPGRRHPGRRSEHARPSR